MAELYDHTRVSSGQQARPSANPTHVFDYPDGIRLIISHDLTLEGRTGVFISASLVPFTPVHEEIHRD